MPGLFLYPSATEQAAHCEQACAQHCVCSRFRNVGYLKRHTVVDALLEEMHREVTVRYQVLVKRKTIDLVDAEVNAEMGKVQPLCYQLAAIHQRDAAKLPSPFDIRVHRLVAEVSLNISKSTLKVRHIVRY